MMHDPSHLREPTPLIEEHPGLIFIPDMSGFTEFVSETNIEHSQHLITELLEVIIDANQLELKMVEIQGDAVLFYKIGSPPPIKDLVEQAKKMFLDFHYHLKLLERDILPGYGFSIPQKSHLTLKFIVHYGDISVTKIKDITKLIGRDVILAHKLLKNPIKSHEYILFSNNYIRTQHQELISKAINWTELKEGKDSYEHIGEAKFYYAEISTLRELVSNPPEHKTVQKHSNIISQEIFINAPLNLVYKIATNIALKPQWIADIEDVLYDPNKLHRVGSKYTRISKNKKAISVQIIENTKQEGKIEYTEELTNYPYYNHAVLTFTMKKESGGTHLKISFSYDELPFYKRWFAFLAEDDVRKKWEASAQNLKVLCESRYAEKAG